MVQFTRLRLVGFKSFVEQSDLLIELGLTGVVGPNGCGKSNLVEAMRWVMGETSAKQMRGTEMDDVIFGGTQNRPPRNVAEVTISLDNRARKAPAMFNMAEELEVTRRIDRGSGSVYRVNGKEVRARDVQLLFADAATGARSTAMVSQGRVGALINAKPAQRRALLEEAAGIGGLHTRRHEAELRLRAAEGNLARLEDVLTALDGQLSGLRRQAKQAARYRELSESIRLTEAMVLRLRWVAAITALDTARRAFEAAERSVATQAQITAAATREQAEAAESIQPLRQAEAEASARLQRLAVAREQLEAEDRQLTQARKENETRLTQAEADMAREATRDQDAAAALDRLSGEREGLDAACAGEAEAQEAAKVRLEAADEAVNAVEQQMTETTRAVAELDARRNAARRALEDAVQRVRRLAGRAEDLAGQRARAAAEAVPEADRNAAREAEEQARAAVDAARTALEAAEAARQETQGAVGTADDSRRAAEGEATRLKSEARGLESVLTRGAPKGSHPPVLDHLTVESGAEKALAAALGEDLSASLESRAAARWTALPPLEDAPPLPPDARPLSVMVTGPEALARRLGQVAVVDDAEAARVLVPALKAGQRLVDRKGNLWRWDGLEMDVGAQDGAGAAAARLETRNRLTALQEEITRADAQAEEARLAASRARGAMEDATLAERKARDQARAADQALNAARDQRSALERKAATAESRLAGLDQNLTQANADLEEARTAEAAAKEGLEGLGDGADLREAAAHLKAEVAEKRAVLVEARTDRDRLLREAEDRARRLKAIAEDMKGWEGRRAQAAQQVAELGQRAAAAREALEGMAGRPEEIAAARSTLTDEQVTAEAARKEAADSLAKAERRLSEADRALKDAEKAEAQARESRVRAESAVDQGKASTRAVAASVSERFDCSPEKLAETAGLPGDADLPSGEEAETRLAKLTRDRDAMGPVNLRAEQEAAELEEQIGTLRLERDDLTAAISRLRQGIAELNKEGRARLLASFEAVDKHFRVLFSRLFGGGRAHLTMVESDDPLEAGLEIMASPPGKRLQVLSLLSGGEQALTATALLFAVFLTNPAPICVLDEVDAPLDDANVDRFCSMLRELTDITGTRFLVVTHHRMTMARMDRLFGVTMAERGVSTLVSVNLGQAVELRDGGEGVLPA